MADFERIKALADEMNRAFTKQTRQSGSEYWTLKDGSPEWMTDVCRAAHSDAAMLPDDYRYEFIVNAVSALSESDDYDEARDSLEPDVYTGRLTSWLASNINRVGYCNDAIQEMGSQFDTIDQYIAFGQHLEMQEVFDEVYTALEARADSLELAEVDDN